MTRSTSRRDILLGAAALAGAVTLPRAASADTKGRIVVGTWGGDYARLLNKNIEVPILIKDGWDVVQDQAGDPERRSKMLAEARLPRGTSDVQGLSALNMAQMQDAGVVAQIDYGKLKNAGNLLPAMKYPYGVGHIYSGKVGVYNPKIVTTAPVSYKVGSTDNDESIELSQSMPAPPPTAFAEKHSSDDTTGRVVSTLLMNFMSGAGGADGRPMTVPGSNPKKENWLANGASASTKACPEAGWA